MGLDLAQERYGEQGEAKANSTEGVYGGCDGTKAARSSLEWLELRRSNGDDARAIDKAQIGLATSLPYLEAHARVGP